MAEYLNANYPPGTRMGVFDIGAIGYFSHIDLIDIGGLVDRNYLPYLLSGRVPQYLQERGANYVILAHNGPEGDVDGTGSPTRFGDALHFFHNPALRLEEFTPKASTTPPGTPATSTPSTPTASRRSTASSPSTPSPQPLPRLPHLSQDKPFDHLTCGSCGTVWFR